MRAPLLLRTVALPMRKLLLSTFLFFCFARTDADQAATSAEQPSESEHRKGPDGLEGWTRNFQSPDDPAESYPRTLVISRHGLVIRQFTGENYIWKWIFWADGQQVAYEDGPLHLSMRCVLASVSTGRELESQDCHTKLSDDAPLSLRTLEKSRD